MIRHVEWLPLAFNLVNVVVFIFVTPNIGKAFYWGGAVFVTIGIIILK